MNERRVRIVQIKREHTQKIVKWRNQDFVKEKFVFRNKLTIDMHNRWYEENIRTGKAVQFIITTSDGFEIGTVYLRDINYELKQAEYGIFIGEKEYLGKGYGTEACNLIIKYGFERLGLKKIILRVYKDNLRAIRSYEKVGFKFEKESKNLDMIFMSIESR